MFYWSSFPLMSLNMSLLPSPLHSETITFIPLLELGAAGWSSTVVDGLPWPRPCFLLAGCVGMNHAGENHAATPAQITSGPWEWRGPLPPCDLWELRFQNFCLFALSGQPSKDVSDSFLSSRQKIVGCDVSGLFWESETLREVCLNISTGCYLLLTYF